jgi:predicted TIM-barrel fold metal-dependent hydrolase
MIWDIHVHVAGVGQRNNGNYLSPKFQRSLPCRLFMRRLGLDAGVLSTADCDEQIARLILGQINASCMDRAVLLAFDAAYREGGTRDEERTLMVTDNDFVAGLATTGGKFLFGASVHPYRRDALAELERLMQKGACLVKWLPSAQNIRPDHPRCFPFYDLLAKHKVPLLSHTGGEHTLKAFPDSLSDPRRLVPALERGVTVIAAHCGTSLFLHEISYFRVWQEMALRHENLFGDISAFGVITRIWRLGTLLRSPQLAAKCVFGSDFPVPPWPLSCVGKIGLKNTLEIKRTQNFFDQSVALMKAAGVTDDIFSRGGELLRLLDAKPTIASLPRGKITA